MSELVMLKKENMNLRKQLKGDNRKLLSDIDHYVSRYDISKHDYQLLINEVLNDFTDRTNLGENLWDTIDNPKEYIDKYINEYNVDRKSWVKIVGEYSTLFIGIICVYFIVGNYFSPSPNMQINPWLIEITSEGFFKCLGYGSYGIYFELITRSNLFRRSKAFDLKKTGLFFAWAITTTLLLSFANMVIVTVTLPKIIIYLVLLICILLVYLIQKKRVF